MSKYYVRFRDDDGTMQLIGFDTNKRCEETRKTLINLGIDALRFGAMYTKAERDAMK